MTTYGSLTHVRLIVSLVHDIELILLFYTKNLDAI